MLQSSWDIRLLGGLLVRQGAHEVSRLSTKQTELLFAMLADRVGRFQPRGELIEALWPDVDEAVGRNRLRVALSYLRRMAEPPGTPAGTVVLSDGVAIALSPSACNVDVEKFSEHVEKAAKTQNRDERIGHYKAADDLYQGAFLAGWTGEWVEARRQHYARLQSALQHRFSSILEESGDMEGAMRQVRKSIDADALREAPRRRALRLLAESGEVGAALEEYEQYKKVLKREVGLNPTDELQSWVNGLRSGNVRPGITQWQDSDRDAGIEDFAEPISAPPSHARVFLPPPLTSFVGRTTEISELSDLLLMHRWITLRGPGGIGKTRLAVETARANVSKFAAGIVSVSVGEHTNPATLLDTILHQIRLEPSVEPLEALRRLFAATTDGGRNACLFVFDGFDQLPATANEVLTRILTEIPNATVMVTSRKSLRAVGEHEYAVGPLAVPDEHMSLEALAANPSVRLFVERARSGSARYSLSRSNAADIAALCRRLEGVPLSIELAAARSRGASPTSMLEELRDLGSLSDPKSWREPRHRSLYASLASSQHALAESDQAIFRSLSVFRGSFEASAARVVAGAHAEDLARLAEHSLLVNSPAQGEVRFRMLDMVREFGWSQLSSAEQKGAQERHAAYFRQLIADVETLHINSGIHKRQGLWQDADNVRIASEWTLAHSSLEVNSRLALGMLWLWAYTGAQQEGREFLRRVRQKFHPMGVAAARLLFADGMLASYQDDPETGRHCLVAALPGLEAAGMRRHEMLARGTLAYVAYLTGDFEESVAYCRRIQPQFGAEGMARWEAHCCHTLGQTLCELGSIDEAAKWHDEAERIWRDLGDLAFAGIIHLGHARVAWKRNDCSEADRRYSLAVAFFDDWRDPRGLAYAIEGLGRVAATAGRPEKAARLLGAAQRLRESIGQRRDFVDGRDFDAALVRLKRELGAGYEMEWKAGYTVAPGNLRAWTLSLG